MRVNLPRMSVFPKNRSLAAKSAARLAAVQLLYRCNVLREAVSIEPLLKEYEDYSKSSGGLTGAKPHIPTLKNLLSGIKEHEPALDGLIGEVLKDGWRRERMNPIALIILKLGFFELDSNRKLSESIIIDEYTTLSQRFLGEEDIDFIHAALKSVSTKFRT